MNNDIAKSWNESKIADCIGHLVLNSSCDCVMVVGLDGTIGYVSPNGLKMLGILRESDILGRPWGDLWAEEERPAALSKVLEASGGDCVDWCAKSAGKWLRAELKPIRDEVGSTTSIMIMTRDVTDSEIERQALKGNEARFRALADNIAQLAWLADGSGYIFWYNNRWYDFTGTTPDEMLGWGWKKVYHPNHLQRVVRNITACFESGEPWEDTLPLRGVDGTYRWFLSRAQPLRNEQGQVYLWCGTNTDIDDQRKDGLRLKRLDRILELSHEAILAWDLETGIFKWNRGCEALYGFRKAEAYGRSSHEVLRTSYPLAYSDFLAHLEREGYWSGELCQKDADGSEVWVESRQQLMRMGDRKIVLETNRDVTDRHNADHLRGILINELNHRVKNTLAIVQSVATQTARRTTDVDAFVKSFSARLQAISTAHMLNSEAKWSSASLKKLINAELVATLDDVGRVNLSGDDCQIPPNVTQHLSLVIHELLTNAVRFGALSRPEGRLIINWQRNPVETSKFDLLWKEIGGPAVSDRFSRGFGTTLIERSGTLPYFKSSLQFEPEGVVCKITADLATAKATQSAFFDQRLVSDTQGATHKKRLRRNGLIRVLIVADDPNVCSLVESILSEDGYIVVGSEPAGRQAIDALSKLSVDLAVVDCQQAGPEAELVLANLEARGIGYVLISDRNKGTGCITRNDKDVVARPLTASKLLDALRNADMLRHSPTRDA